MKADQSKAQELCKKYRDAYRLLIFADKGLISLNGKQEAVKTEHEKHLFEFAIERRTDEIDEAKKVVRQYERYWMALSDDEKTVLDQLYKKGCKWSEVRDKDGKPYSMHDTIKIWRRGLNHIAKQMMCDVEDL